MPPQVGLRLRPLAEKGFRFFHRERRFGARAVKLPARGPGKTGREQKGPAIVEMREESMPRTLALALAFLLGVGLACADEPGESRLALKIRAATSKATKAILWPDGDSRTISMAGSLP